MQAITTKYFGPSNVRGARVKATAQAKSVTIGWDHSLNFERNHLAAAQKLATMLKWEGTWIGGGLPDGSTAWVNLDERFAHTFEVTA